jgi:hypothetical protein
MRLVCIGDVSFSRNSEERGLILNKQKNAGTSIQFAAHARGLTEG